MGEVPDGYERFGEQGLQLVDPEVCPAGHPFRWGQRSSPTHFGQHEPHLTWHCRCGQWVYRSDGEFVSELACTRA